MSDNVKLLNARIPCITLFNFQRTYKVKYSNSHFLGKLQHRVVIEVLFMAIQDGSLKSEDLKLEF